MLIELAAMLLGGVGAPALVLSLVWRRTRERAAEPRKSAVGGWPHDDELAVRSLKEWVVAESDPNWQVFERMLARVLREEPEARVGHDGHTRRLTDAESAARAVRSAARSATPMRAVFRCQKHGIVKPVVLKYPSGKTRARCPECGGRARPESPIVVNGRAGTIDVDAEARERVEHYATGPYSEGRFRPLDLDTETW